MSETSKAYARGYMAGRRLAWPEVVPSPPVPVVAKLIEAITTIRNYADGIAATLDPEDELVEKLNELIDAADAPMLAVNKWIEEQIRDIAAAPPAPADGRAK